MVGGSGNDTFLAGNSGNTAANQTLNTGDILNGGEGTDTLTTIIGAASTYALSNVSNIENVNATFTAAGTLSLLGATGVTSITSTGSTAAAIFNNISDLSIGLGVANTDQNATFTYTAASVAGAADSATLTLNGQSAGTNTIAGIETLNIVSTGSASVLTALTAAAATTLNVSGDADLNLGSANTVATTVDASALTGALTYNFNAAAAGTITGGAGNDSITVTGGNAVIETISTGAGNDTVIYAANLANTDVLDGGDGDDELRLDDGLASGYTTPTTRTITNFERLQITGDLGASFSAATIQQGFTEVIFNDGIDDGLTLTLEAGTQQVEFEAAIGADGEAFTIADTGVAIDDSLTLENGAAGTDVFTDNDFTINGFETVTITNSGTGAVTTQNIDNFTINADSGGTSSLIVTGRNAMTFEAITANVIDFSGVSAAGTGTTILMGAAAVGVTTITGSEGNDTLLGDASSTINGGGGIDTITGGANNDVINGGAGNDIVNSSAGEDAVDLGEGNDRYVVGTDAHVSASDTVAGGDGVDILEFAVDMTDSATTLQSFSGFETLRMNNGAADTISMSNLLNTQATITKIEFGDAGGALMTVNNAGSSLTDIQLGTNAASVTGDSVTVDLLVDGATDSITVKHDSGGNAATVAALVLDDHESITITTDTAADDLTITALDSADLTTLTLTGAGDIVITAFTAVTDMPTTVDATGMSGAATVHLTSAVAAATMTGGSGGDTFTGGLLADTISGGAGDDTLVGGNGADTIDGGTGADTVTGGAGGDTMTGGAGQDTFAAAWGTGLAATSTNFAGATVAVGDTMTFGNGVDIVTDFTAGTGGDIVNTAGAAAEATLIGETVADLGDSHVYWASGSWDAASKTFIFLADGSGPDTMVIDSVNATDDAADVLTTNSSIIILIGVDTDNLVAANIA